MTSGRRTAAEQEQEPETRWVIERHLRCGGEYWAGRISLVRRRDCTPDLPLPLGSPGPPAASRLSPIVPRLPRTPPHAPRRPARPHTDAHSGRITANHTRHVAPAAAVAPIDVPRQHRRRGSPRRIPGIPTLHAHVALASDVLTVPRSSHVAPPQDELPVIDHVYITPHLVPPRLYLRNIRWL